VHLTRRLPNELCIARVVDHSLSPALTILFKLLRLLLQRKIVKKS
jgi:hypothetical protein